MKNKFHIIVFFFSILVTALPNAFSQWVQTNGPGPGNMVSCFVVSGANLFAGTYNSIPYTSLTGVGFGVFRSTNNGMSWIPVNNGLGDRRIHALAASGGNLFAGTSLGVYLSTNNGTSWKPVNLGLTGTEVSHLLINGSDIFAVTNGGSFHSTDNGASWKANTTVSANCLAVMGTNLFAGVGDGVLISSDNGKSWSRSLFSEKPVKSIVVRGTNIFAGSYGIPGGGVFLSSDSGKNWTSVLPANGLKSELVNALAVSGTNLFAGIEDNGVLLSTNNGSSWTTASSGLTNGNDVSMLQALTVSGSYLIAGTSGGVFSSSDNGTNWTASNTGLTRTSVRSLAVNGTNLFAGTNGYGLFRSSNNGISWDAINTGLMSSYVSAILVNGTNLLAGTYNDTHGVYISFDSGSSWLTSITNGLQDQSVNAFAIHGTNVFAGADDIFLSTDNGVNWKNRGGGPIYAFAESGTKLFAGTWRSTDDGTSWKEMIPSIGNHFLPFSALVVSGKNLLGGDAILSGELFLSTDYGDSWTTVNTNSGLTNLHVRALLANGGNLFAATFGGGVFLSTNDGTNWTPVNEGLTDSTIRCLATDGKSLFAGGDTSGVWHRPLSDFGNSFVTKVTASSNSITTFPNPFSQSTSIKFSTSDHSFTQVSIHNLLGSEVARLFSGTLDAGEHVFSWDAQSMPAGMYVFVVRRDGHSEEMPMMLVR